MRLKSQVWVTAYVRRCASQGVAAAVVRHGDDDAGSVFVRVSRLDGTSLVFGPAPAGLDDAATDRQWTPRLEGKVVSDDVADSYLKREIEFDSDLWIVEIEDRAGRHFLDGWLASSE